MFFLQLIPQKRETLGPKTTLMPSPYVLASPDLSTLPLWCLTKGFHLGSFGGAAACGHRWSFSATGRVAALAPASLCWSTRNQMHSFGPLFTLSCGKYWLMAYYVARPVQVAGIQKQARESCLSWVVGATEDKQIKR